MNMFFLFLTVTLAGNSLLFAMDDAQWEKERSIRAYLQTAQAKVDANNFFVPYMIGCSVNMFPTETPTTYPLNVLGILAASSNHFILSQATHDNHYPTLQFQEFPLIIEYQKNSCDPKLEQPSKLLTALGFTLGAASGYGIKKYVLPLVVAGIKKSLFNSTI